MENEKKHPINEMMEVPIQKVRDLVDANTIIGEPIAAGEVTLIPVSKLSIGFGTGGSEFASKNQGANHDNAFGGGGAAGVKVTPVAFLVVAGSSVKVLNMAPPADTTVDRIVDLVPDVVDKISAFLEKKKTEKAEKAEDADKE
jgi:sporulation protein YtfJ